MCLPISIQYESEKKKGHSCVQHTKPENSDQCVGVCKSRWTLQRSHILLPTSHNYWACVKVLPRTKVPFTPLAIVTHHVLVLWSGGLERP